MKNHPGPGKTESYVHAQQLVRPQPGPAAGPFVTLSREAGAGASSLAQLLKQRLDAGSEPWTVFDGNLIAEMLRANQLPPGLARFLPEGRVSEIEATIGEIVGLHPSLWELAQKTNEFIARLARMGRVILVGRGAAFATAGFATGVHVRLVAPPDQRAKIMAARHGRTEAEAAAHNLRTDRARRRYVRTHFDVSGPDPLNYDLVINTSGVPLNVAADSIVALVQARSNGAALLHHRLPDTAPAPRHLASSAF